MEDPLAVLQPDGGGGGGGLKKKKKQNFCLSLLALLWFLALKIVYILIRNCKNTESFKQLRKTEPV
jgi:lysophospholipid acyltransferase (LPLAT)-like uncharacterized protein